MPVGLLFECDDHVAKWAFKTFNLAPMSYDKVWGLLEKDGTLVGAILYQSWNGFNVELSIYCVRPMLTAGIIRCVARCLLFTFNVSRVTVATRRKNKSLMRSFQRLGFRLEGAQRRYYGERDCNRNTAIRFVMFRERLEQLAALPAKKERQIC